MLVSPFAADVAITNSDAPDPLLVGATLTYTLTVTNNGPDSALATAVVDTLPAGVSFVSVGTNVGSADENSGVVTATLGNLAPGAGATITIQVTPNSPATLVDRAYVSSTRPDPALGNNEATATTIAAFALAPDVQLVKRASAASFAVGQPGAFSFSATNIGSLPTTASVTVADTLPAGVTYLGGSGAGWSVTEAAGIVTASHAAALAPGDSAVASVQVQFGAAGMPGVTNFATAQTAGDSDPTNNRSSVGVAVTGAPDLAMAKRHVGAFQAGQNGQWALGVTNVGNVATGATVTVLDTLPTGATFVSGSGTGWIVNAAAGIVTATYAAAIAPGDSATFAITAAFDAQAVPAVTNSAVAQVAGDLDPANDRAVDTAPVGGLPDLQLVKRDSGGFTVGAVGTYALSVTNLGTTQTTGVITVRDSLPAGVSYVGASGTGWSVSAVPPIVTATYAAALAPLDSLALTIDVRALAAGVPSVSNTAIATTAGETNPGDNTATRVTPVSGAPDLALAKRHAGTFTVGTPAQYALVATNVGNIATAGTITVLDTLPAGLAFTGGAGTGWTVNAAGGIVTATNPGPIAAGDSASFTVNVSVAAGAVPGVTNTAVAQVAGDLDPANDRAVDPTAVQNVPPVPDVQLVKRAVGAPFTVGGTGQYALSVTNLGTGPTTGAVTITDALAGGLTFVSGGGAGWNVNAVGPNVTATYAGAIAAGDSAVALVSVHVGAAAAPAVGNFALASTAGDVDAANDSSRTTTPVNSAPDIALAKRHAGTFTVGQPGAYTLAAVNVGNIATSGTVTVLDTLPAGLSFTSGAGTGWAVNAAAGIVTATYAGAIAPTDSAVFSVNVGVAAPAVPLVTNSAVAQAAGDVDAANDRAVDPTTVQTPLPTPDLQLVKRHNGSFAVAATGTYALTVTNVGNAATSGPITLTDVLPAGLTYAASAAPGWAVQSTTPNVVATYAAALAPGDSATFNLTVNVGLAAFPATTNLANAQTAGDANAANNQASDPTTVTGAPDLVLSKSHSGSFTLGVNGTYQFRVKNVGNAPTTGAITVTDSLPNGLSYVSGNGANWVFGNAGTIVTATNPGPLAPGDSILCTLTVAVAAPALGGVTNIAAVATPNESNVANNGASDFTNVNGVPDLALFKRHTGTFTVGQAASYDVVVRNVGTAASSGLVTVRDTLPAGLTYASAPPVAGLTVAYASGILTATSTNAIAVGDSLAFSFLVNVGVAAYPSVTNAAVVTNAGDTNPLNNRGVDTPAVVQFLSQLALAKSASPARVEPADVVSYALTVADQGVSPAPGVAVRDTLPVGFRYVPGTALVNGSPIADPSGGVGPALEFAIGTVPANGAVTLRYRALVGTAAVLGDGTNRALAVDTGLGIQSNRASAKVTVDAGVFADDGVLVGKVFADCGCDSGRTQGNEEVGVPGVRVYLEDGRSAVTDVEGKYHFERIEPRLHTVKVDRTTLPVGAAFETVDTRDGLSPGTRFADVQDGELARADFALAGCDPAFRRELLARRELGEVTAALPTGVATIPADVLPGATRVLAGPAWSGPGTPAYEHIGLGPLDAANSLLPDAPGVPGQLSRHAVPATTGLSVSVPAAPAPADGRTLVPVTVHVPGDGPTRVTLETDAGWFEVVDLDPKEDGVQTMVDKTATFALVAPRDATTGAVRVTLDTSYKGKLKADGPTALAAVREAETPIAFVPPARPWLVAGVVEGRFDHRSLNDDELAAGQSRDRFESAFTALTHTNDAGTATFGGRGAVFARGTLAHDFGVTLRYDSEHAADARRFEDIRPNEGEPGFGDASLLGFEAQSTSKLFARVDHGRSYALYGDFATEGADPIRVLGAYTRGENGGRAHLENGRVAVDGFATHDTERQVVDELPGRGISGPYALSHADGVLNSEKVELVTRDRNNPSVILDRRTLTRFADYTIEPFTGRLLFKAPVPILDERLNPVSVRVSYELQGGGDRFWTGGGSAHVKATSRVELMGSYVKESDPTKPHEQFNGGGSVDLGHGTSVTGEWAHTDSAGTNDARALRGEIRHSGENLDLRGYALRTDPLFDNPSSGYAPGREEWGGSGRYLVSDRMSATAEGVRSRDVVTGGRRKGVSLGLDRRLFEGFSLGLGYRWARESATPALGGLPVPTPTAVDAARLRATWQFSRKTSAFLEYEKNVGAVTAKRFALGADARVTDHVRVYGRHEFENSFAGPYALNDQQGLNSTVFGVAADGKRDLSAFSEYRVRDALAGRTAEAALGLRDQLRLSRSVRMDWSIERVSPTKGGPTNATITALTSGFEWTGDPLTKGSLRLEYRAASDLDQWLATAGLARKLGRDWTGLARTQWSWVPGRDRTNGESVLALALRETDRNRWNALARVEHHLDETVLAPAATDRHEALIASMRVNLRPSRPLTLMTRLAGKWTADEQGAGTIQGQASLVSGRATYDLSRRFDVGAAARARMDGGFAHRTTGVGAEVGATVARNLRAFGGYNVFGFHDADFAALERTDKGVFAGFGFKFDEGLFGHRAEAVAPPPPPADDPFQRGAVKAAPGDTLNSVGDRISDEAIATDLRSIDGWTARARALPDSAGIYARAKALGWLAFARAEYAENDRSPIADAAFKNGVAIVRALTPAAGTPDSAAVLAACGAGLPGAPAPADMDLAKRAADLRTHPGFHCAQEWAAGLEIALARATHEAHEGETCRVPELLAEARADADSGFAYAEECIKPVAPPPVDTLAMAQVPPEPPLAEIQAALSAIPSGIHFALNHYDLSLTSKVVIHDIAAALAKYGSVKIDLEGHTDSRGSVAYNLALSKRRVNAVRDGLVAAGVDSTRISTSHVGKSGLLNAERNTRDLALNRRVEFLYFDKTGAPIATTRQTEDIQIEQPKAPAHRAAPRPGATKAGVKPGAKAGAKPAAKPATRATAPTPAKKTTP